MKRYDALDGCSDVAILGDESHCSFLTRTVAIARFISPGFPYLDRQQDLTWVSRGGR